MRLRALFLLAAFALCAPALGQEAEYPTLEALANLEIPAFDYAEMVSRFSRRATGHKPPATPPEYDIGDSRVLHLDFSEDRWDRPTKMYLRGQSPRVLIWAQSSLDYPVWRANALAKRLETEMLDPIERLFKFAEPPGVDGDPRLHIAMIDSEEADFLGYFDPTKARPKSVDYRSDQLEMVIVNLSGDEEIDFYDEILIGTVAHEYLHALQNHSDPGEEWWLDEALASYADYHTTHKYFERSFWHFVAEDFLAAPDTGLTQWFAVEDDSVKYGAGFLFVLHLVERFGEDILARLLVDEANGWRAIQNALREYTEVSAEEIFADWALANYFLDHRRGYGYRALAGELDPPQPTASYNSFPAAHEGELPQYSTEYIAVDARGAAALRVRLRQADEARLVDAHNGLGAFAYAATSEDSNSWLTRAFNLNTARQTWMEFRFWHELDDEREYGYVSISEDDGENWHTLRGRHTDRSEVYGEYYLFGYTGSSSGWRIELIDISDFAPGEVLIRFEIMSNFGTLYRGMAIDELRIRAIDYHENFESPDDGWVAEGWLFTDNRLPNNTWLQAVQDTGHALHVSRALMTGAGELMVEILPGVSQALVAVSPIVPQTGLLTEYALEIDLLDAAGDIMVVSRECSLTTTHALNFRSAPNGDKIGLLAQGTTVDALDRDGNWFKVVYAGRQGWVHGDYVHAAGNCP